MNLCAPFDGWTLDLAGVIHTPSGYRCTPAQIEAALWLHQSVLHDRARRTIFADTPMIEPRRLAESNDWIGEDLARLQIIARRGSTPCPHCHSGSRCAMPRADS